MMNQNTVFLLKGLLSIIPRSIQIRSEQDKRFVEIQARYFVFKSSFGILLL